MEGKCTGTHSDAANTWELGGRSDPPPRHQPRPRQPRHRWKRPAARRT
jgi:hypothetical protein